MKKCALFTAFILAISTQAFSGDFQKYSLFSDEIIDFPHDDLHLGEDVVDVENVFIPRGFDANDKIEIIVSGWKPSPCYGTPRAEIVRSGNDISVVMKAKKMVGRDRLCIDMAVHYMVSVPVEPVPAGNYNVTVNADASQPQFAQMEIAPHTGGSIDDFLYADVDHVTVDAKTRTVTLEGENPSPCIVLDKIMSTSNGVDTYALMPIMRKKDAVCPQVLTPFVYKFKLPNDIHAPKVLVHVRTLNGNSKNRVFGTAN